MVPVSEFDAARQACAVLARVVGVGGLRHEKSRIIDPEIGSRTVAALWLGVIEGTCRSRRITIEKADQERKILIWRELRPHGGRGERVGWSSARQVGRVDRGPSKSVVDEKPCSLTDDEFGVGC